MGTLDRVGTGTPTSARTRSSTLDLTWVGHATAVLDLAGMRVLTDPLLTDRVAHLRRRRPLRPDAGDEVDLVLVSHAHVDHLHIPSLRRVGRDTPIVVPEGTAAWLRRRGFTTVSEVDVGQWLEVGPLVVRAVPAEHQAGRGPHSRLDAKPVGYVVSDGTTSVYFPGDTDLSPDMAELAGVDVALLPIWGWGPNLGEGHLDPERAVTAVEHLDPGLVIPIHWGTYSPVRAGSTPPSWLDRPAERFGDLMATSPVADRLRLLLPGDSLRYRGGQVIEPTA